jgi:hypothetical protein
MTLWSADKSGLEGGMKRTNAALLILLACLVGRSAGAADAGDPKLTALCATNPAYSITVMRSVLDAQLQRDHDPSLDSASPDELAQQAVAQGITECSDAMHKDPSIYGALASLPVLERQIGWDAYNTACSDRTASKGACITAEVGSVQALKHLAAANTPPGARALVQACELILKTDPAMADWRECVDEGLRVHASADKAAACKLSVNWHVAKTGVEAGKVITQCLRGG